LDQTVIGLCLQLLITSSLRRRCARHESLAIEGHRVNRPMTASPELARGWIGRSKHSEAAVAGTEKKHQRSNG
jgi:hypothetical protein